jgi:hypothetical protein
MVALLGTQDLAVGEDGAIIADDPKLKVERARPTACWVFR